MIISHLYQFAGSVDWAAPGLVFCGELARFYFIELEWSINRPIKIRPDLLNNILQHSSNKWKLMEIISVNLISRDSNSTCQKQIN